MPLTPKQFNIFLNVSFQRPVFKKPRKTKPERHLPQRLNPIQAELDVIQIETPSAIRAAADNAPVVADAVWKQ